MALTEGLPLAVWLALMLRLCEAEPVALGVAVKEAVEVCVEVSLSEGLWVTEAVAELDCDADREAELLGEALELAVPLREIEGIGVPEGVAVMVQEPDADWLAVKVTLEVDEIETVAE